MNEIRKSQARGYTELDWLKSYHTFSFAEYRDPAFIRFGPMRVLNEDWVAPDSGFGTHPHDNMEIVTYVIRGQLEHKDSMGNGSVIQAGDVQRMSAGTGLTHSEFNPSGDEEVHLLQIWFFPKKRDVKPSYEQKNFNRTDKINTLKLVTSEEGRARSVSLGQDVDMYASILEKGEHVEHTLRAGRGAWLHLPVGHLSVNGKELYAGDGMPLLEGHIEIHAQEESEFVLIDMAMVS